MIRNESVKAFLKGLIDRFSLKANLPSGKYKLTIEFELGVDRLNQEFMLTRKAELIEIWKLE